MCVCVCLFAIFVSWCTLQANDWLEKVQSGSIKQIFRLQLNQPAYTGLDIVQKVQVQEDGFNQHVNLV